MINNQRSSKSKLETDDQNGDDVGDVTNFEQQDDVHSGAIAPSSSTTTRHRMSKTKETSTYPSSSKHSTLRSATAASRSLPCNAARQQHFLPIEKKNQQQSMTDTAFQKRQRRNYHAPPLVVVLALILSVCIINFQLAFHFHGIPHQPSTAIINSATDSTIIVPPTQNVEKATMLPSLAPNGHHNFVLSKNITTNGKDSIKMSNGSPMSFGGVFSRPFSKWSYPSLPCYDPNEFPGLHWTSKKIQRRPTTEGLLYIKLVKTGSSTTSGIHLRIARNLAHRVAQRKNNKTINNSSSTNTSTMTSSPGEGYEICRSRFLHGMAGPKMLDLGHRNRTNSFLWSIVREPTKRYISDFFHFQVSRRGVLPTAENLKSYLRTYKHKHHSIGWLSTTSYQYNLTNPTKTANNSIMNQYDFLGIVERLDESLIVLSMLLDIPLGDILYLGSKRSGGYDDGAYNNKCYFIQPSNLTSEMKVYLSSDEWQKYVEPERRLFQAINHSLDLTIERLGRQQVNDNLQKFQKAQLVVQTKCLNITKFPCSSTGERREASQVDCWTRDLGCGFDCLDQVAKELGI